jgi:DNA-binding transcriptional LysR family regulator
VLEEAEQADAEIGALLATPRGRLRIGAPAIFARVILEPILGEFLAAYPELRLSLHLLNAETSARDKNLDLMIRPGPLEDSGLLVKPLLRVRLASYASPVYLKDRETPASPGDLRRHNCITTHCGAFGETGDSTVWRLRSGDEWKEVCLESRVAAPDPTITLQLAVAGVGVAMLSQASVRADVAQGRLVWLLPDWEPEPVQLHALYSSRLSSSPKVRAFLQFLRDRLGLDSTLDIANVDLKTAALYPSIPVELRAGSAFGGYCPSTEKASSTLPGIPFPA